MQFRAVVMKFVGLQLSFLEWSQGKKVDGGSREDVGERLRFQVVM